MKRWIVVVLAAVLAAGMCPQAGYAAETEGGIRLEAEDDKPGRETKEGSEAEKNAVEGDPGADEDEQGRDLVEAGGLEEGIPHSDSQKAEEGVPQTGAEVALRDGAGLEEDQTEALGIQSEAVFLTADCGEKTTRSAQAVLTVGKEVRYGSYTTNYFYINGHLAYCLEPVKKTPGAGGYEAEVLENGALRKAMYYLMGGPGWSEVEPAFAGQTQDMCYAYCHCVLSWIYNGYNDNVFLGFGSLGPQNPGENFCKNVANWIARDFPEPPDAAVSITPEQQDAVYDPATGMQRTGEYYVQADSRNQVTFTLPENVALVSQGTTRYGTVTVSGGLSFYLEAPPGVSGDWHSGTLLGSVSSRYLSFLIKMTGENQDIGGLVHAEVTPGTGFGVKWNSQGRIIIEKTSEEDGSRLKGAVFEIWDKEGKKSAEVTTGEDGTVASPLLAPGGEYTLKEIKAPEGYEITEEARKGIRVFLDPSAAEDNDMPVVRVEVKNPLRRCSLEVKKRICAEDIVWAHGNPVFLIEAAGKDLSGKEHLYARMIEFDPEYVKKHTGTDGYVEASAVIQNIPCGTAYRIMEKETARYYLKEAVSKDENIVVKKLAEAGPGKLPEECFSVTADLLKKPEGSCVAFQNEKGRWNLWSHTSAAVNQAEIKPCAS